MPRSWTSSPDLHLELVRDGKRGRRAALERAMRDAIHHGRLAPGTVVPSTRALARDLHLGRGTVVEAYAQLVAEGYLVARAGSVTAVADTAGSVPPEPTRVDWLEPARIDLRPGLLDLARTFPRAEWLRAERAVFRSAPDDVFDYGDPRGRPELRAELARYLGRARGVVASPDHIVICSGFSHGLSLVARALAALGTTTVAMEDPCLPVHRSIVHHYGHALAPLRVDDDGAQVESLSELGAHAAVVTPAHQYPTGGTLNATRRAELVRWARRSGGVVVEDDYDGEFRYDRLPVGAVQGLDPEHVVYAGTTSKTLAPGVRLGWLVLPPRLVGPVIDANRFGVESPSPGPQLVLAQLLAGGAMDRHLRRLRVTYRRRRDVLVKALAHASSRLRPTGIAAGLHLLVFLDDPRLTEDSVRTIASRRSVAMAYLGTHWHDQAIPDRPQGILVGYSRPSDARFPEVVQELVDVIREAAGEVELEGSAARRGSSAVGAG